MNLQLDLLADLTLPSRGTGAKANQGHGFEKIRQTTDEIDAHHRKKNLKLDLPARYIYRTETWPEI